MDLATLIGFVAALVIILITIALGGDIVVFVNVPSLVIVVGGTFSVVMFRVNLAQFIGAFKIALKAFLHKSVSSADLVTEAVGLADVARKEGVLALEGKEISHPFLKAGIGLCIDGHDPAVVQKMLARDINLTIERHDLGVGMFRATADAAPAMGMIGTLIGLVQMLANMDDPKSIGPAMAVALLTTLYGAIIATAIAIPLADKLKLRSNEEKLNKKLILESIDGIQEGLNPRVLEQILNNYLPPSMRESKGG